jgi:hypothetical protein
MAGKALVGRRLEIQSQIADKTSTGIRVRYQVIEGSTVIIADGVAEFSE